MRIYSLPSIDLPEVFELIRSLRESNPAHKVTSTWYRGRVRIEVLSEDELAEGRDLYDYAARSRSTVGAEPAELPFVAVADPEAT